uniref:CRAL-TRIO domain-containing protein n=1 Tax=Astyanax mexicanus TaxID=7994 RepID=A0A3B1IY56_ASTMX
MTATLLLTRDAAITDLVAQQMEKPSVIIHSGAELPNTSRVTVQSCSGKEIIVMVCVCVCVCVYVQYVCETENDICWLWFLFQLFFFPLCLTNFHFSDSTQAEGPSLGPILVTASLSEICTEAPSVVKLQDPLPLSLMSVKSQPVLAEAHNVNPEVLSSGVLCLPGTRDKSGHALVIVTTRNTAWLNPNCNSGELVRIMVYFYTILRKEMRALGLTVLVDARRCSPVPALFKAFNILQVRIHACYYPPGEYASSSCFFFIISTAINIHCHIPFIS